MNTDPRRLGGDIAGPGGPYEEGGVTVHTENAVLLEKTTVARVDIGTPDPAVALLLCGRINKTPDFAQVLFLMDDDGAAAVIVELLGLLERMDHEGQEKFLRLVRERLEELP